MHGGAECCKTVPIASDDVHTSEPPRRREEPHVSSAANDEIAPENSPDAHPVSICTGTSHSRPAVSAFWLLAMGRITIYLPHAVSFGKCNSTESASASPSAKAAGEIVWPIRGASSVLTKHPATVD